MYFSHLLLQSIHKALNNKSVAFQWHLYFFKPPNLLAMTERCCNQEMLLFSVSSISASFSLHLSVVKLSFKTTFPTCSSWMAHQQKDGNPSWLSLTYYRRTTMSTNKCISKFCRLSIICALFKIYLHFHFSCYRYIFEGRRIHFIEHVSWRMVTDLDGWHRWIQNTDWL